MFGVDSIAGSTNFSPEASKERLEETKKSKHVIILKSGTFGDAQTGDILRVEMGDIFPVERIGSDAKPTGEWKDSMAKNSIDILVNNRPLKLFPHEFAAIEWVTIMLHRKAGEYQEAYLGADDKTGYFKPSDDVKAEIVMTFGDR